MKAMILAAGRGLRMRPLSNTTPKALLKIAGTCLIDYHLQRVRAAGITEVVINLDHLGEMIREHLKDGQQYGLQIHYSDESGYPLETAGGIIKALPLLGDEPFFVINADVYTDYAIQPGLKIASVLAHLVMVDNPPEHACGDFCLRDGYLHQNSSAKLTFSGMGYYQPALFEAQPVKRLPLTELLLPAIAAHTISGEHYRGIWADIGTMERLAKVSTEVEKNKRT